ncbi:MAG: pitrilysin family protein [Dermatophilus congolensis]|nr:pitrilysin family protein [Dermatophilus congolensis]
MSIQPRPVPEAPREWVFPTPERFELSGGSVAAPFAGLAFDTPGQHVISVRLAIPLPVTHEPRHVEGIARVFAATLTEGTAARDAMGFAETVERLGASISVHSGERALLLDLDVPSRNLEPALGLLVECLTGATFPEAEVAREVRRAVAGIASTRAHPAHRATIEFAATYYAAGDRLSRPFSGSQESVSAITREDVLAYAGALGPSGSTVVIAGDLGGIDPQRVLGEALGAWTDGLARPESPVVPGELADDRARIVIVDRPGSVQSELLVGCPGPGRRVEGGWAPYPVLSYLIGGTPNSRLDAELREKRGFTYGMRSAFRPRSRDGQFVTSGSVRTEVTSDAVAATLEILDVAREGFMPEETKAGVDFLVKTAPSRYETADMIADEAVSRALDGSDTDEVTQVLRDTMTLTPDRLQEAYQRYVDGAWTVVVVGDATTFADDLRALGRGDVSVVE